MTITLSEIRDRYNQAPTAWKAEYWNGECRLKAIPPFSMGSSTAIHEEYATLRDADYEAIQLLSNAYTDIGYLLAAVDRGVAAYNRMKARVQELEGASPGSEELKNYAAECAIKCTKPAFKKFLKEVHGLGTATDEATAGKVRELLGISSRNILNKDPKKADLWRRLVRDFDDYLRYGSGRS